MLHEVTSSCYCCCCCCCLSRWQRFNAREVVWFLVGTSYDIITHAIIAGLLAQQLLQPHTTDLASV